MKKHLRRFARENPTTSSIVFLAVGGLGAIGLAFWLGERSAKAAATSTSTSPSTSTPTSPTSPSSASYITLIPNQPTNSVAAKLGEQITIQLPAGAYWTGQSTGPNVAPTALSGSRPISWTYQGPGTVYWTWVDSTGQPQSTQYQFYTTS